MYREKINELYEWNKKKRKFPLLIKGARRVGKTFLVKEFLKNISENTVYINFGQDGIGYLDNDLEKKVENIGQLINLLSNNNNNHNIIVVLDNIENLENVKEIKEILENKNLSVILVTSRILEGELDFKVQVMNIFPLNYQEFLYAIDEKELADYLEKLDFESIDRESKKYINNLKKYIYIGGMPEVVENFARSKDYRLVRENQKEIIKVILLHILQI